MSKVISFDTETAYDKDDCTVKRLGNDMYTKHPRFECYMISVCDGEETWAGHPRGFNWDALRGATLVSHNAGFDQAVFKQMVDVNTAPPLAFQGWFCTADLSAYTFKIRALDAVVKHAYGVDLSKGMRNWMQGKTWADAVKAGKDKEMLDYARRDAYWCYRLWKDHSDKWPAHERELSRLTFEQARRGIAVDVEKLQPWIQAIERKVWEIEKLLPWVEGGKKPTSPKALAEECHKVGIPCPPTKVDDEEGFIEWENTWKDKYPWVLGVSDHRSVSKVLATLRTIKDRVRSDGTVECPTKYFGAHTGRWSGEGGINFQNFPKEPLDCGGVKVDLRSLFIPRPGKKMIICDLSQIEPRVLNWVAGNEPLLKAIRDDGFSYYEAYARLYKGWDGKPGTLKKEYGQEKYTKLKNEALGLGYQMGWERLIGYAKLTGIILSEEESKATVNDFRTKNPLISAKPGGLWDKLHTALMNSIGSDFTMALPSGREMRYLSVRRTMTMKKNDEGKMVPSSALTAITGKQGRLQRLHFYGGKLTENLVQATARDVFAWHWLRLEEAGFQVLFSCHDEVIIEADPAATAADVQAIMSQTPPWLEGCPVSAEAQEVDHYCK